MGMTRQERISLHKKQERLQVKDGVPVVDDLSEGVPALRATTEGVVEYVRHKNVLYKKVLVRDKGPSDSPNIDLIGADNSTTSSRISFQDGNGDETQAFQIVNDTDNNNLEIQCDLSGGFDVGFSMARATGVMSGDFNDTSDVALKENIIDNTKGLSSITQLKPREFDWKNIAKGRGRGFIAQELEGVLPECVTGRDGFKAINTTGIVSVLVKAIQELSAKLDIMQEEINNLKSS